MVMDWRVFLSIFLQVFLDNYNLLNKKTIAALKDLSESDNVKLKKGICKEKN